MCENRIMTKYFNFTTYKHSNTFHCSAKKAMPKDLLNQSVLKRLASGECHA